MASIDIGDIAEVAVSVLTDSSSHEGKTYPITGPEALNMTEVAEKLSTATGKPIHYVNVTAEEARSTNSRQRNAALHGRWTVRAFCRAEEGERVTGFVRHPNGVRVAGDVISMSLLRAMPRIFRGEEPAPEV